jgi:hypothetical protein
MSLAIAMLTAYIPFIVFLYREARIDIEGTRSDISSREVRRKIV